MDATTAEAVRWLRKLRRMALSDREACLADLGIPAACAPVFEAAKRALQAACFYTRKRCATRVKAIDRAIATLEAQP